MNFQVCENHKHKLTASNRRNIVRFSTYRAEFYTVSTVLSFCWSLWIGSIRDSNGTIPWYADFTAASFSVPLVWRVLPELVTNPGRPAVIISVIALALLTISLPWTPSLLQLLTIEMILIDPDPLDRVTELWTKTSATVILYSSTIYIRTYSVAMYIHWNYITTWV